MMFYILTDDNKIIQTEDVDEWTRWRQSSDKWRVALTSLPGGIEISTVFLTLNHEFRIDKPPILFETMVFGGEYDEYTQRYRTYVGAEAGHKQVVEMVSKSLVHG